MIFFRNRSTQAVAQFEEILDENIPYGITSVIYQEVLQGADSPKDFSTLQTYLASQKFYLPVDPILSYAQAAALYFQCRRQGITVQSTIDCLIAQIAIEHKLRLVHSDRDFTKMTTVVKNLKLA